MTSENGIAEQPHNTVLQNMYESIYTIIDLRVVVYTNRCRCDADG